MLNNDSVNRSAKIYQFPTGGRASLSGLRRSDAKVDLAAAASLNQALCFDSWYHQAAIEDSKPVRDH